MKKHNQVVKQMVLFALLMLVAVSSYANNGYNFDQHVVYYNAFTADSLPAEMAKSYGLTRSKSRGILNISVQEKAVAGKMATAVNAKVSVWVKNLVGQGRQLSLKRVTEGAAIYYISEFRVSHKELMTFEVTIVPAGQKKTLTFSFKQQFYTN